MAEDPGKAKVGDLVKDIHNRKYVIPHFQRGYEWQPNMVSDLFESIIQDYYAGLLLFWELDTDRAQKEAWEDPVWDEKSGNTPSLAILDGQQRLASLYYAIYNPERKFPNRETYYRWFLDLDKCLIGEYEEAVYYRYSFSHYSTQELKAKKDEWLEKGVIPLAILSDSDYLNADLVDFLSQFAQRRYPESWAEIFAKLFTLIHGILNYEFVTTTLGKGREIHDICNIFARINKMGMRLSTFDLMNAFLYPYGISLRKGWEDLDNKKLKEVDRNMNEYLLKLISLHVQGYCSSKYIYNLIPKVKTKKRTASGQIDDKVLVENKDKFGELWESACEYAEKARWRIMNIGPFGFGAIKSKFIPNTTIVPVLGAVLWEQQERHDEHLDLKKALNKWYWSATLSGDYSGSSDTVMAKDFRDWQRWFDEGSEVDRATRVDADFVENELDLRRTTRGAQYNAILCMLALNCAKDFYTGIPVAHGDYSEESIDDHHIFPTKVKGLSDSKSTKFEECKDSILNRTLLLDKTDKTISNKKPSVCLNEMMEEGPVNSREELEELMEAHLISSAALDCLFDDDFDSFIVEREKTIKEHILTLVYQRT